MISFQKTTIWRKLFKAVVDDMNFLTGLLSRIYRLFYSDRLANQPDTAQDDKLQQLLKLLKKYPNDKLLIFSEFCDTARYLYSQLRGAGFRDIEQIDKPTKGEPRRSYPTLLALL